MKGATNEKKELRGLSLVVYLLLAVGSVVALHLWRRNTLLSIFGDTAVYMLLVQMVF